MTIVEDLINIGRGLVETALAIEKQVTIKGIVFACMAVTVCACIVLKVNIPEAFGTLFMAIAGIYFGVGAVTYAQNNLK